MKKITIYFVLISLFTTMLVGCKDDDDKSLSDDSAYPPPAVNLTSAESLVAIFDAETKVLAKVESEFGIRDVYVTLMKTTEKGYVEMDKNKRIMIPVEGEPKSVDINVPVLINSRDIKAIKIVSLNGISKTTEQIIKITDIKDKPVIAFFGDIDYSNTVSTTVSLRMRGTITNNCDITSISFIKTVNGVEKTPIEYNVSSEANKQSINYTQMVPVENGLEFITVRVKNIYDGYSEKKYTIKSVVNVDFIDFILNDETFATEQLKEDANNTISSTIASASDIESIKFSSKTNGVYSAEKQIALPPNTFNEATVSQDVVASNKLEALKFVITNKGGVTITKEFAIKSLNYKVRILRDVVMSTDPADNLCYIALYEDVPIFGQAIAKTKQERIDWVITKNGTNVQPVSPHAYGADVNYYNRSKDYLWGFNTLTYMFLTARRGGLNKGLIDQIVYDSDIMDYLTTAIIKGENYNIPAASRRVGDTFNPTKMDGFVFGWGTHTHPTVTPAVVKNESFGIGWVKKVVTKANEHHQITFDIVYPRQDQRAKYNASKIVPYNPYPLQ